MFANESPNDKIIRMVRMHFAENPEEKKKHGDEPEEPRPQDCCGLSCNPCIFDLHHQDVMLWAKECARCIKLENGMTLFEEVIGVEENVDNLEEIFSKDEYRQFEIVAITKMAPNTNMYKFKTAKSKDLPLGCHLIARSKSDEGRFLTRQYTPSKIGNGYFEIPIKVYDDGRFSRIVATWKLGDMIDWRGPYDTEHEFNFRGMPSLLIVCGGTGIAPIPRILERIFGDERVETRVRLVCCFSDPSSVLFREEISKWTTNWNCQIACYFSRKEEEAKLPYLVEVHNERFTEVAFEEQLEKLDTLSPHPTLIVCGSLAFEKDVINYAIRQGIPSEKRIRFA